MAPRTTRRALLGGLLLAAVAAPLTATVTAAIEAPASAAVTFTSVTVRGQGLSAPLELRSTGNPDLFNAMVGQVSWLADRPGQTARPPQARLGPKYTIVLFAKNKPRQTYDLYPQATGGPRVFRPAKQPDRRSVKAGWFLGRLNMSETLRVAGVPLTLKGDTLGGAGGGQEAPTESAFAPMEQVSAVFAEWRRLFMLNTAVVLLIAAGLAGFSLLIRRKV